MPAINVIGENTTVQAQAATWVSAAQTIDAGHASILLANAEIHSAQALAEALRERDGAVVLAHDRGLALRTIVWQLPDLVILDAQLAGDDGIDLCVSLKNDRRTCGIPIVVTAEAYDAHEHLRAVEAGADDYLVRSDTRLVLARVRALLQARRRSADMVPLESVLKTLEQTVEAKDDITGGHQQRLGAYASLVGERLGLSGRALDALRTGARLHDVGKIGVDDAILRKPGALTADEYIQVQQHTIIGEQILAPLCLSTPITAIVRYHHERWDGRGYPDGLMGKDIPLGARIVAVADAFDAMTAERPYSQPMTVEAAIERLRAGAGAQWDPEVVRAMLEVLAQILPCRERAVGQAPAPQSLPMIMKGVPLRLMLA
jgi:putative two-component system response regulator